MNQLLYTLLIRPISMLPLRGLYVLSACLFFLFRSIFPYRRKVIRTNIEHSFPNKTKTEKRRIERDFYQFMSDLILESIKNMSLSETEMRQRLKLIDNGVMAKLFSENQKVILVGGHYHNFEWLITGLPLLVPQKIYGIGMPLSNPFWDLKLTEKRERFGMKVVHSANYKSIISNSKEAIAVIALSDQAPVNTENAYWTNFLNQTTPVLFGAEYMANEWNAAVVYLKMEKTSKGNYTITPELITSNPHSLPFGTITQLHVSLLEKQINEQPAFWLWSHKRWKRAIPEDLKNLHLQQKTRFEQKFRRE
jgi:Kdo2-lipid IVA lauroyltransferase/acyltransferase